MARVCIGLNRTAPLEVGFPIGTLHFVNGQSVETLDPDDLHHRRIISRLAAVLGAGTVSVDATAQTSPVTPHSTASETSTPTPAPIPVANEPRKRGRPRKTPN